MRSCFWFAITVLNGSFFLIFNWKLIILSFVLQMLDFVLLSKMKLVANERQSGLLPSEQGFKDKTSIKIDNMKVLIFNAVMKLKNLSYIFV